MKVSTKAVSFAMANGCLAEGHVLGGRGKRVMMRRGRGQGRCRQQQGFGQGCSQGAGCFGKGGSQGQMLGGQARGGGRGYMMRGEHVGLGKAEDRPRELIQRLLDNHDKFERHVELGEDGVHAQTWVKDSDSIDDEERAMLADWLQRHVAQMALQQYPVRSWDPLFAAIHNNGEDITLEWDPTEFGVNVTHSGATPCAAALVEEHTAVVTGFVDRGRAEASQSHGVPLACPAEYDDEQNPTHGSPESKQKGK